MANEQKIIDKIIDDANVRANEIIEIANKEAENVLAKKHEELKKEEKAFNTLADSEAEKAFSKEISGAERRAKQIILSAKQEMIKSVVDAAAKRLNSLSDDEYRDAVMKMLEKADFKDGTEVLVNEKDFNILKDTILNSGYKVSDKFANIEKGFIIKKGDIEYNYSFASILTIEREEIEKTVANILFM